jgi:ATP-dependent helicase/nuclease subunit B
MASNAAFKDISGEVEEMEYWFVTGGNDQQEAIKEDKIIPKFSKIGGLPALLDITKAGIEQLAETFLQENTPYLSCPDPEKEPDYNDFEHLARHKEWQ